MRVKERLWQWPDGLVWKITEKPTLASRRRKYGLFISLIKPRSEETIFDVGVAPYSFRTTNFLEQWYPYPGKITALTNDNPERFKDFHKYFPEIKLIFGDGKSLDFPDDHFDIVFCNAVIEHIGCNVEQKKFIEEICRVGKRIFVTTPNYWFPLDPHTLIPCVHWLPQKIKYWIYRKLGRGFWANINRLNLLASKRFLSLFPKGIKVRLYKQRIFGITSSLIVLAEKN